jgi:hypothetical protein
VSNPKTSEKSVYLDREEHVSKGAIAAKRVALYTYDSNTDSLLPYTGSSTTNYTTRIAENSGNSNLTYIGNAIIGSSEASAVWQIKRLDATTGLIKLWSGGTDAFDKVWDNRESGSYT